MSRHKRVINTFAARVRKCALSLPQTYEDAPWGFPVFKVADNKLFAWMIADENALHVTMKLTPDERELARMLPYVRKASHLGRYGWITAAVTDDESLESALEWICESYWLRAPVELRKAVETVENVDDEPR